MPSKQRETVHDPRTREGKRVSQAFKRLRGPMRRHVNTKLFGKK